jgi:hypothetical protein
MVCDYCRAIGLATSKFSACSKECALALMCEAKRLSE